MKMNTEQADYEKRQKALQLLQQVILDNNVDAVSGCSAALYLAVMAMDSLNTTREAYLDMCCRVWDDFQRQATELKQ